MSIAIATGYPGIAYNGEPTFAGILQKYFVEIDENGNNVGISRFWNDNTAATCKADYENRILPTLHIYCDKNTPAGDLTGEIFENTIESLKTDHNYADGTVEHYRLLIYRVYMAGVDHGHYADALFWEEGFDPETATEDETEAWRVKVMTRIRKSFNIDEEFRLARRFSALEPETAAGEDIGLLLSFTLGMRNNEVCGADFKSVRSLDYYPEVTVFDMLQTTRIKSSELKGGGKTSNAPRTLLMMEPVAEFIYKRKAYLAGLISDGTLILPEGVNSVDDLPIVCKGNSYLERAGSMDLTAAGKRLFQEVGIDSSELTELYRILCSTDFREMTIEDKSPTTYLFRRNVASHLHQLGFEPAEIQYWMGHEIEDPFIRRSFFADPDQLYLLKAKWDMNPVLMLLGMDLCTGPTELHELPVRIENAEHLRLRIPSNCEELLVKAEMQEPSCKLSVDVNSASPGVDADFRLIPGASKYPRYASIAATVLKAYKAHAESINN